MNEAFDYPDFMRKAKAAFQPYSPIELIEMFQGRNDVVEKIVDEITTVGRHVILYGDRGVGKTSIANLIGFFAKREQKEEIHVGCYSDSGFSSIFAEVLQGLAFTHVETSETTGSSLKADSSTGILGINLGIGKYKSRSQTVEPIQNPKEITPALVARVLASKNATIVIDEYDRIENADVNNPLAETIKRLSDIRSNSKIIVVGVAESASKLVSNHESLQRSCAQIRVDKMSATELEQIIDHGSAALGLRVPFNVRLRTIDLADGYPHFMHLLGLKLCEAHGKRIEGSQRSSIGAIDPDDFQEATSLAIEASEETLSNTYSEAIRHGTSTKSAVCHILDGMALSREKEVKVADLIYNIRLVYSDRQYSRQQIQSYLTSLCKQGRNQLLVKVRPGTYKFSDPRMRAFIRILLQKRMPRLFGGQLSLFDETEGEAKLTAKQMELLIACFSKIPNHTTESITYSNEFDLMYEEFARQSDTFISKRDVWRHLQNLRKRGRLGNSFRTRSDEANAP